MAAPQDARNKRLKNDYSEMVNLRGNIITWKATKGNPPFVEEYEVTINVKSVIGNSPNYRDSHVVKVNLPANYPIASPDTRMVTTPYVFHPNWYRDGKWCYGTWNISEGLGHHVIRMIRTLQYDMEITNEHSPANSDANEWYLSKRSRGIFPCDKTVLPDPTKKKMTINPPTKKKFDIK